MANAVRSTLKATLDNGLTVIIRPSGRAPVASFWTWYRVGARNEVPGITGISHWVEHMQFKGTPSIQPGEIFRSVNTHGGTLNGFTWIDYTAYFETLPSADLLLAADIESDRMHHSLFRPEEVESERTVILSERAGNENQPGFSLREEVGAAAFRAHPYGQGVIGYASDLHQITRDDLYHHYRTYYAPNNATVVVVGDVDPERMLDDIARRFGTVERGEDVPAVRTVEPAQQGERRVTVRRPAPAPLFLAAWHAPEAGHPDAPAMIVLDAVLSGGKSIGFGGGGGMGRSSRLYRQLVATGLASSAGSSFSLSIDPYLFSVSATLVPTVEPDRVEEIVFNEIERLRTEPVPDDELQRAVKQLRAQFAYAAESVTSQAYWLGSLQTVAPEVDPDAFIERITSVTPDDVLRVAATYLDTNNRTVGRLEPILPSTGAQPAPPVDIHQDRPAYYTDGHALDDVPFAPYGTTPQLQLRERTLGNGLRLIGHHDPTSEAIVIDMRIEAGAIADGTMPGLARFTGQMLARGTARCDFAMLNEELDGLGAAISVGVGREHVDITGKALREDARRLVELMSEVVLYPTFPVDEIEHLREQSLNALRLALNDTRAVAAQALRSTVYPAGHPYHHRLVGTEETLRAIQREHLERFHRTAYRPERAIIATAGGVPVEEGWSLIEEAFAGWSAAASPAAVAVPPVEPPPTRISIVEDIPGKTQADIAIGLPTVPRSAPDYDDLRVANVILGQLGLMGRLGERVREREGMAYYVYSALDATRTSGMWSASAGVSPSNIGRAVASILAEVERLRNEPVTADELADARSFLIGSLPVGLESSDAIAAIALDIAFYDLGLDYIERLPQRIGAVTVEAVQAAAQRYLATDRMVVAVAQPAAGADVA